jgi:hypothetical protein
MFIDISEEIANGPWFKIVEFLQQSWAVLIEQENSVLAVFYGDTRGVFDEITFETRKDAEIAFRRNGFSKYTEDPKTREFIGLPSGKFHKKAHPKGSIYSSGQYWK